MHRIISQSILLSASIYLSFDPGQREYAGTLVQGLTSDPKAHGARPVSGSSSINMLKARGGIALTQLLWLPTVVALQIYINSWAVEVPKGPAEMERIARKIGFIIKGEVIQGSHIYHLQHPSVQKESLNPHWAINLILEEECQVYWFQQQTARKMRTRQISVVPTDPMFHKQWYMNNDLSPDLNVLSAWGLGFTGRGVVVTILDDGIEKDHPDLEENFDPMASYDFNDDDPDPQPRYNPSDENRHGTRCAGEVAAVANNNICGVGIAYNARIGGVRMLDGLITDSVEARSLSLNSQYIHVYSASWGPEDDGKTLDGPGRLATEAFHKGIVHGRGGLGSIFVWASGNGGLHYDNCNGDGYTNSIFTLSVGSTTENGEVPWYSEACASTLTTTFSSGMNKNRKIVTTDIRYRCTEQHTGTSASAPLAAGIIALALEANPALTWRDVQHIVVRASSPDNLITDDWVVNGVGRKVSHHYGYGLLDAGKMVDLALKWETTRPQRTCLVRIVSSPRRISSHLVVSQNISGCSGTSNYILSIEHVQAQVSLSYTRRGDLEIYLTSPMGTRSVLMGLRPYDTSSAGYQNWSFMSTHTWDENPQGTWTLELVNKGNYRNTGLEEEPRGEEAEGLLYSFVLILYGTNENLMARKIGSGLSECVIRDPSGACQECELPFYIYGNVCIIHCPPKYFKDLQKVKTLEKESHNTKRVCAPCHPSCHTCSGDSASNCTSCPLFSTHDKDHWSCSQVDFNKAYSSNAGFAKPPGITLVAAIGIAVSEYVLLYVHLFLTTVP
ncbi:proprotein convertase subtilisin/kexin type 4 isoform X2 [Engystomops pustulosus]|uniref:proprotein convertase subtilisin/kexin type 4 isoform X2 n=1 Tax=Engystomops pustulosus TaxID=76066 RepID=UPI003AFB73D9